MGIVTKTGDKGKTSLYCGKRVNRDDMRVEICGAQNAEALRCSRRVW